MEKREIKLEFVEKSEKATLYTICFRDENASEFSKFMLKYKDNAHLKQDYRYIVYALSKILKNGVLERNFRPEGKIKDNVCALPLEHGKLRLYCLRISDQILIIGNGGIKDTKTYDENSELSGYVISLQKFEDLLRKELSGCQVTIEITNLDNLENKYFEI